VLVTTDKIACFIIELDHAGLKHSPARGRNHLPILLASFSDVTFALNLIPRFIKEDMDSLPTLVIWEVRGKLIRIGLKLVAVVKSELPELLAPRKAKREAFEKEYTLTQ
jgi:hypothetical protein